MARKIPHRNRSPHGWWIASYIERAVWDDEPTLHQKKRCYAWENTIILKAHDRQSAYAKAIKLAPQHGSAFEAQKGGRKGHWTFEGLTSLLPIYEPLEDGTEILWVEHERLTYGKLRRMVRRKNELEAFDDTPSIGDKAG